jgi:hypothetical protein
MGKVPEYNQSVGPKPIPIPTAKFDTRGSFGGDLVPAIQTAANVYGQVEAKNRKYDDARVNSLGVDLFTWEQQNVQDETNPEAAKAKKGAQYSPEITDTKLNEYDKKAAEIRDTLANQYQVEEFDKVYTRRRANLEADLHKHEATQHEQVSKEAFEGQLSASIIDGRNYAFDEPARNTSFLSGLEVVKKRGRAEGWTSERVDEESRNFATRFHTLAATGIGDKSKTEALKYVESKKDQILPKQYDELKTKFEGPAIVEEARNVTSAIR